VYLSIVQSDQTSPLEISRKLSIPRTKVYRILDKLLKKSLVEELGEGYGKRYRALHPGSLLSLVQDREKDLFLLKMSAPAIVQHLESLMPEGSSEVFMNIYTGKDGLEEIMLRIFSSGDKLRIYGDLHPFLNKVPISKVKKVIGKSLSIYILSDKKLRTSFGIDASVEKRQSPFIIGSDEVIILTKSCVYFFTKGEDGEYYEYREISDMNYLKHQNTIFDYIWQVSR
jgi:sugar-specific transcriptional regulator TrmB